jgi:hypothetical protein
MALTTIVPYDPVLYAGDSEIAVILEDPHDGHLFTIWFCSICYGWTVDEEDPSDWRVKGWRTFCDHILYSNCHHDLEDLVAALPTEEEPRRYTHTVKLTFVVDSDDPLKPLPAEILNTIQELMDQAPEYLASVDVIDTARS